MFRNVDDRHSERYIECISRFDLEHKLDSGTDASNLSMLHSCNTAIHLFDLQASVPVHAFATMSLKRIDLDVVFLLPSVILTPDSLKMPTLIPSPLRM